MMQQFKMDEFTNKLTCLINDNVHRYNHDRKYFNHVKTSKSSYIYCTILVFGSLIILSSVHGLELEVKFHGQQKQQQPKLMVSESKQPKVPMDAVQIAPASLPSNLTRKQDGGLIGGNVNVKRHELPAAIQPRRLFDFITDPSLLITVLHSLEVAYWTFPMGFALSPIINFFRVPNRRSDHGKIKRKKRSVLGHELTASYVKLLQSLDAHKRKYNSSKR